MGRLLSRIRSTEWPREKADATAEGDTDWQTWVDLELVPNPDMDLPQQETIKHDYGMRAGKLKLRVRRAMLDYTLAHLRLPMASGNDMGPVLKLVKGPKDL